MIRTSTDIELKDRSVLTLDSFRGAELSTSPYRASHNRAVDMENLICTEGLNQKRDGWECLLGLEGRINGIFHYREEGEDALIIHRGAVLESYDRATLVKLGSFTSERIRDMQSSFFYNGGRVFILCGDYIVYEGGGSFVRGAEHSSAYVPTTSVNVPVLSASEWMGTSFEGVNLLTRRRKNSFAPTSGVSKCFALDGVAIREASSEGRYDISARRVKYNADGTENESGTLELMGVNRRYLMKHFPDYDGYSTAVGQFNGLLDTFPAAGAPDKAVYFINADGSEALIYAYMLASDHASCKRIERSVVKVNDPFDEFCVTYRAEGEDKSSTITDCELGILFGTNGNTNRLFLTGSRAQKNGVYYSEYNDLLYFSDLSYVTVGSSEAPVTGFLRLLDNTVAVFKGTQKSDASVYYMTGSQRHEYDSSGTLSGGTAVFSVSAGGIGEVNAAPHAAANLIGDSLMLSENGVFGITFTENITTGARYAKERSFNVNERLKRHKSLAEAVGTVYGSRYYLSVDDVCYVADPRFKFYRENDMDSSYNYEWWYWTNVAARCFCEVGGELWFGTAQGRVCRFKRGSYTDDTFTDTVGHNFEFEPLTNEIFYNIGAARLCEGDEICFQSSDGPYARLAECTYTESDGVFRISPETLPRLREGAAVTAGVLTANGELRGIECKVARLDAAECTLELTADGVSVTGEAIAAATSETSEGSFGFALLENMSDNTYTVTDVGENDEGLSRFRLAYPSSGAEVDIASYVHERGFGVRIVHRENVVSRWVTPYFDLGSALYSKTLLRLSISTVTQQGGGELKLGYRTRYGSELLPCPQDSSFSLDSVSFENFTLDVPFADSYTLRTNVRNFNYIQFVFVSERGSCAVNSFTALYRINKLNRGLR